MAMQAAITTTLLLPVALLFVSAVIMSGASASSPSSLRFHYIDPRNFTMAAPTSPSPSSLSRRDGRPSLALLHRDAVSGRTYPSTRHAMLGLAARDGARAQYLQRRLSPTTMTTEVGSEVVSGISEGSGEYFVRVGVGSPPTEQYLVVDSGSDVIWVQCRPCAECYQQADPLFDPAGSASFAAVPCGSGVCRTLPGGSSGCADSGACRYQVSYGDGSYTQGVLAMETLTFGDSTPVQGVAIGCGHRNRGLFVGAAGLLGLGWGPMSLVGQLGGAAGGAFSYCLASRGADTGAGSLVLGRDDAMPVGAVWVPLLRNAQEPSFYYVGLTGLGVGGEKLPLQDGLFDLTEDGGGGVVMDTGTAVTRLPADAYAALRDAFADAVGGDLPRAPGVSLLDTCYDLSGYASVRVPTVALYFGRDGAALTLPARNLLVEMGGGVYCLAFAASASGLSILGNIQQQGIQITVDSATGYVGFGPATC
ncbi:protein ASPARTIC PROTEASE IN GUARD CELL 2-like [Triticum dicoccoides]|uniref:protein ASPARTIC PROTEASE IN GUARD CELL 2-like n=1 Tax=Triticum dicoccoides TaxID=85692 RepID=UPI00188F426D|nr:protein ASPARTIC PROTEASE IN GUARD CELL 2-like [Triticum dicoccoides]